jgi:hypothetical protein
VPSLDSDDDFVWISGPDERLACDQGWSPDEAFDSGLELDEGAEDTALEAAPQFGEEAFNGIELGAGRRGEVEDEARMAGEPRLDLGMLVGRVVVDDDVNDLARRHLGLAVEETDGLLMAVALHARPMTLPSSTLRAANRVVVLLRMYSCVMVPSPCQPEPVNDALPRAS